MPLRHPVKYVYIGHREEGDKGAVRLLRTSGSRQKNHQLTSFPAQVRTH